MKEMRFAFSMMVGPHYLSIELTPFDWGRFRDSKRENKKDRIIQAGPLFIVWWDHFLGE
jgi:hypothetical protein